MRERRRKATGQATIELVLTFAAFFTIFFMYVQVSLSFAVGNYIQYATYLAARAFLSSTTDGGQQKDAATKYLQKMLGTGKGRFGSIIQATGGGGDVDGATVGPTSRVHLAPSDDARDTAWEQGVTYAFKAKMYLAPMIPGINTGEDSKVSLESQTWLGREPTQLECEKVLQGRASISGVPKVFYDNGC